ncbi:hypothetical protein JCM11251_003829 [Rhodosporidiobolus azoricus]
MASYLASLLRRASVPQASFAVDEEEGGVVPALPAPFYHSEAVYQLERRAIWSTKWIFACHERLLDENGKYQLLSMAGYNFFVIRDKHGEIRAFHNTCRHRGFTFLKPQQEGESRDKSFLGKAQILSCGYHGWSYATTGNLVKAPGFQDVPGFDKEEHGLLPLRVHTDKNGFVYVSMDMSEDAIEWEDQYGNFEEQERFKKVDFENYTYSESWGIKDAQYNYKILVDNYSECHHCQYTHPGFVQTTQLSTYNVQCGQGYMAHYVKAKPEALTPGADPDKFAFNFIFPAGSHTITPFYFYTMRICPTGPRTCNIEYDVFRHRDCTDEIYNENHKFFVQVETEDKMLCMNTQRGLEMGTYNSGPLHPTREQGVVYFQKCHLETLRAHFEKEQAAGHEIRGGVHVYGKEAKANALLGEIEGCSRVCGSGGKENEW